MCLARRRLNCCLLRRLFLGEPVISVGRKRQFVLDSASTLGVLARVVGEYTVLLNHYHGIFIWKTSI